MPRVLVMVTLEAACTALFQRHPERAIELAREHLGGEAGLRATVAELAAVCHTSVSRIAVLITPKKAPEKRAPHRTRAQRTQFVRFVAEPQWVHYVRLVGAAQGMNLSATIRKAGWEFVQRNAPNPPTEGSYRGPSRESVTVKPERRLLKRGR